MKSATCKECGQRIEAEPEDLESKLRAHYLGKSEGHEYPGQEEFKEKYGLGQEKETQEEQEQEDEAEQENTDRQEQEKDGENSLLEVEDMEETDLDDLVEEAGEEVEEETQEGTPTQGKGLNTAINNAWGRIFTVDLDPEEPETNNVRKNLKGLAEDVGLGENAKKYYEENLSQDTENPKSQLIGSLILAIVLSASMRPDLMKKLTDKAEEKTSE